MLNVLYKFSLFFLLAAIGLAIFAQDSDCDLESKVSVIYINGMMNSFDEAESNLGYIHTVIKHDSYLKSQGINDEGQVALHYQESEFKRIVQTQASGVIQELFYFYEENYLKAENLTEEITEVLSDKILDNSLFFTWIERPIKAPNWFREEYKKKVVEKVENTYVTDSDLNGFVNLVLGRVNKGNKVVIVSHSQGNFYANQLWHHFQVNYNELLEHVSFVPVATPSNYTPKDVPYTTLTNDLIMGFVRFNYPLTLPGNYTYKSPYDKTGHGLAYSYLGGSPNRNVFVHGRSSDRFSNLVRNAAQSIEYPECKEIIPCNSTLQHSGSSGTFRFDQELGSQSGPVEVGFEAYFIPDSIKIRANDANRTLLSSSNGPVSGYHSDYEFNFDYEQLNTTSVEVEVIGNENSDTQWDVTMSCPNDQIPNERLDVKFEFGKDSAITCHSGKMIIDGYLTHNVNDGVSYIPLSRGIHTYRFTDVNCTGYGGIGYKPYSTTFTDSIGKKGIFSLAYHHNFTEYFEVQ